MFYSYSIFSLLLKKRFQLILYYYSTIFGKKSIQRKIKKTWKQCRGLYLEECSCWGNPRQCQIQTLNQFSTSNPEVFVHVGLSIANSVGEFSIVPDNWVLSVIWLRVGNHDFEVQFSFYSTRFRYCKGCAYHFVLRVRLVIFKSVNSLMISNAHVH